MLTNKQIETLAINWVMQFERQAGRKPTDVRHVASVRGHIYSAPRLIEVKAVGKSQHGNFLWLEPEQVEEARCNPNFYLYVVEVVSVGESLDFRLKILSGERLARLLDRATVVSGDRLAKLLARARETELRRTMQSRQAVA